MVILSLLSVILWSTTWLGISGLTLSRIKLPKANLLSIFPSHIIPSRKAELLYVPSPLSLQISNHASSILDDNHWVSRISDCGYPVHTLELSQTEHSAATLQKCVIDALAHLEASKSQIVLIANELSCLGVLHSTASFCKKHALSHQIQGLIMLDPPPLHSLQTEYGRQRILQRFAAPDSIIFPTAESEYPTAISIASSGLQDTDTANQNQTVTDASNTLSQADAHPVTEKELDYYERLLQKQQTGPLLTPRQRKRRHRLSHNAQHAHTTPPSQHLTPGDENEHIIVSLESGMLTTTELLGEDVLPGASAVRDLLSPGGVLVVGTINTTNTNTDTGTDSMVGSSSMIRNEISVNIGDSSMYDSVDGTGESSEGWYDEASLFCAADDWGAASLNETASIYSAYPVQYIPLPSNGDNHGVNTAGGEVWSSEEIHQNIEIARVVDIFVRKLAL